ncbi:UDP-glucuronosyltransferase 2B30 [Cryptotermes secundus]|uniref:UDP-glucuronosyltransferase n=2 Tax=Cryptotermes secundus TaxID=105785 RepID=A0A2J7Q392_9NEOP|nr:UDP-glucuronosyltransferase 2B30 [Cryptotermes secundus]
MMLARQSKLNMFMVLLSYLYATDGARILGIFPMPAKSHMIVHSALMKELARRGHEVTVFSPFPEKFPIPNFTDIEFKLSYSELLQVSVPGMLDMFNMDKLWFFQTEKIFWDIGIGLCNIFLQDDAIQRLLFSSKEEFDLLITSAFTYDCVFGMGYKLNIPIVKICPFGGREWMDEWFANPSPYAYVPEILQEHSERMNLWQRIHNTLTEIHAKLGRIFYVIPQHDAILRKHLHSNDIPSIWELQKSTALILFNNHFSTSYPRPLMPNMVEVGGMHISPPKKLCADLQRYLDESSDGVIFFSMGSNLRSSNMKNATRNAFLQAFSKLKQKVLWKWETDSLPGKPNNVKLGKWLPQSDILAHPNVRLFMTHGGLLSTQEAVVRGIPIVGIPIYGDQGYNLAKIVSAGIGIKLDVANITTESVLWAVNEVLNNPRYRENMQRLSRIYRDQPLTPLEQAAFWTEYVIRHKGAPHMRSAALDLSWYQYFLLDVIAVLSLVAACVLSAVFLISRAVIRRISYITPRIIVHGSKKNN